MGRFPRELVELGHRHYEGEVHVGRKTYKISLRQVGGALTNLDWEEQVAYRLVEHEDAEERARLARPSNA